MTNEEVINRLSEALISTYERMGMNRAKKAFSELLCNRDYSYFNFDKMEDAGKLADSWDTLLEAVCDSYIKKILVERPVNLSKVSLESKLIKDEYSTKNRVLQRIIKGDDIPGYTDDIELIKKCEINRCATMSDYVTRVVTDVVIDDLIFRDYIDGKLPISNVELYPENLEKAKTCFSIDGHGFSSINQGWGQVGEELFLASRICRRKNQEDAGIIMVHPSNPKFKLMVVADGMGGHSGGETASATVISQIKDWFEKEVGPEYYEKPEALQEMLKEKILEISKTIDSEARQGRNRLRETDRPRNNILWCYCGKR